jgi:hypothetical protein
MPATGNGATLGWASSANVGTITSISGIGGAREAIETSDLATTGGREFIPSDLVDYGELSIEGAWAGTATPIAGAAEVVTVTIGTTSGNKTWSGSGFVTAWETGVPMDDLVSYSLTIKCSGDWALA